MRRVAAPDRKRALESYRVEAASFDRKTRRSTVHRIKAVDRLKLEPGDVVLDVACGTGVNFDPIARAVGPSGKILGIDLSPEMLSVARRRTELHGYENVKLFESPVEDMSLDLQADAALFSLAHDVLRSDAALAAVMAHLKPGARIAAFGAKRAPGWNLPVRLWVWRRARSYFTTFEGYDRPWDKLERAIPDLRVESVAFGSAYLAWGVAGGEGASRPEPAAERLLPAN